MRVAVLGAGLQGAGVALELARRGVDVVLVDQDEVSLNRASLRNEGKVHLGLVYANDPTLATATSMLDGALTFGPLLDRWTRGRFSGVSRSQPFQYFVAHDSLLSVDELVAHYDAVESLCRTRLANDPCLHYLGTRPDRLYMPLDAAELAAVSSPRRVAGGFATAELALDLPSLVDSVRGALAAEPAVRFVGSHRVTQVERSSCGFRVKGKGPESEWSLPCDQVVNALWDGRLTIDATVGVRTERAWVHRLKYRVLVDLPPALRRRPSATFVLGPYGDVVVYDNAVGYVSWYPVCMRGWSADLAPPEEWDAPCRGVVPVDDATILARRAL